MKKNSIYVKTLGGFGIECNGNKITLGRNKGSKYIQLIARVCAAGDDGVTKEDLQEDIYSDDLNAKSNLNNSLNNLIYQFKKVAQKAGIPDGKLIIFKDGSYFTDPELDVTMDAVKFEECITKANAQKNPSRKRRKSWMTVPTSSSLWKTGWPDCRLNLRLQNRRRCATGCATRRTLM